MKVITTALSCIRTIDGEHMPYLLRFLLLSASPLNVHRIISGIREQLKFLGISSSRAQRGERKGKSLVDNTEASILDALRSSLLFKNVCVYVLCCIVGVRVCVYSHLYKHCYLLLLFLDAMPRDFEGIE